MSPDAPTDAPTHSAPRTTPDLATLLHRGGPAATWGNLGLWTGEPRCYADAAAALATTVAQAAAVGTGQRVLCLACGAGDELLALLTRAGVAEVVGVERDPRRAAAGVRALRAAGLSARGRVLTGAVLDPGLRGAIGNGFDAVLCVDAAYHLSPRAGLLHAAAGWLRPGGRLAFTDLVLDAGPRGAATLRAAAALCGVPRADLVPQAVRGAQLQAVGFADVQAVRLDEPVLDGFARFVQRQRAVLGRDARRRAWWPAEVTAALIGPCRAAGLGYALFGGHRP
jgi:SAM-dependent methyltransferase